MVITVAQVFAAEPVLTQAAQSPDPEKMETDQAEEPKKPSDAE